MNNDTRVFNGMVKLGNAVHKAAYQARVTKVGSATRFLVDVVIFRRSTGEIIDSFERDVYETHRGQRKAVEQAIAEYQEEVA